MVNEYEIKKQYEALATDLVRQLGDEAFVRFEELSDRGKKIVLANQKAVDELDKRVSAQREAQSREN